MQFQHEIFFCFLRILFQFLRLFIYLFFYYYFHSPFVYSNNRNFYFQLTIISCKYRFLFEIQLDNNKVFNR